MRLPVANVFRIASLKSFLLEFGGFLAYHSALLDELSDIVQSAVDEADSSQEEKHGEVHVRVRGHYLARAKLVQQRVMRHQ